MFLRQMKTFPNVMTVCDRDTAFPHCDISLNRNYGYRTLPEKTMDMFKKAIEVLPDENVFLKYDDDVIVDYQYILSVVRDIESNGRMYFGDPMLCLGEAMRHRDARCMNGKFYGVSRPIVECFANLVEDSDIITPMEDVFFGSTVWAKCKYLGFQYKDSNESLVWHKRYQNRNKCANLSFKGDHKTCMAAGGIL
jgi:Galactosyltransferase